jgi:hypothetical protein
LHSSLSHVQQERFIFTASQGSVHACTYAFTVDVQSCSRLCTYSHKLTTQQTCTPLTCLVCMWWHIWSSKTHSGAMLDDWFPCLFSWCATGCWWQQAVAAAELAPAVCSHLLPLQKPDHV